MSEEQEFKKQGVISAKTQRWLAEKKRKEEEEAKKKRRRVNPKFAKLTNTHLAGTPIGDVLQAALEGRDIEGSATGGARFDVA